MQKYKISYAFTSLWIYKNLTTYNLITHTGTLFQPHVIVRQYNLDIAMLPDLVHLFRRTCDRSLLHFRLFIQIFSEVPRWTGRAFAYKYVLAFQSFSTCTTLMISLRILSILFILFHSVIVLASPLVNNSTLQERADSSLVGYFFVCCSKDFIWL